MVSLPLYSIQVRFKIIILSEIKETHSLNVALRWDNVRSMVGLQYKVYVYSASLRKARCGGLQLSTQYIGLYNNHIRI